MIITYKCTDCNKSRYFSSIQKEKVTCKECGKEILPEKGNIGVSLMTTEESRFMGDEAIYNTVGKRVSGKHSKHYTGK